MKNIKVILSTSIVLGVLFTTTLLVSCKKGATKYNETTLTRPCDNVICLNGATCVDGLCNCAQGYEGVKCDTRWNEKFVGVYKASDDCLSDTSTFYEVEISANSTYAYKINIANLGNFCPNTILNAEINPEKTTFAIPMQNVCGDSYLSGYGNISGNYLNIYLKSRDTILHSSTSCSILLSK
jgi:hypothetical protein